MGKVLGTAVAADGSSQAKLKMVEYHQFVRTMDEY